MFKLTLSGQMGKNREDST